MCRIRAGGVSLREVGGTAENKSKRGRIENSGGEKIKNGRQPEKEGQELPYEISWK